MFKCLLRSIIDFGDGKISREMLNSNYLALAQSSLEWINPDERKIFEFMKEYAQDNLEPPSAVTIKAVFERRNEITVTEKLDDIKAVPDVRHSTNFTYLMKELVETQTQNKFRGLLTEIEEIATKGKIFKKGTQSTTIKGTVEAIQYFNKKVYEILPPERNGRTKADVKEDAAKEFDHYMQVKANPVAAYGRLCGIKAVDNVCHGLKPGELWTHAAAPGHLKTAFATNWAYNLATRYRSNALYVSMEMPAVDIEQQIFAMHTSHARFAQRGISPLDRNKIKVGELSPEEEMFYQEAMTDLNTNPEYCRIKIWSPDRHVTVPDIRTYAEIEHKSLDIGMIILDHGELIKPTSNYRDRTVDLNEIVRELKMMALHFDSGAGIPVLLLYQINRAGQEAVAKKKGTDEEGEYSNYHLSYANGVEKDSDCITTTYKDDVLDKRSEAILYNMKNRSHGKFPKSKIRLDYSCMRIYDWDPADTSDMGSGELTAEDLSVLG